MDRETHRCAICAAEFDDSKELVRHEHSDHRQQADTSDDGSRSQQGATATDRQNHEFSRRNFE
jgi:hypothetical protein